MMKRWRHIKTGVIVLLLLLAQQAVGQYDGGIEDNSESEILAGVNIQPGAFRELTPVAGLPHEVSRKTKNKISLYINENVTSLISDFTSATVNVTIAFGSTAANTQTITKDLTVSFKKALGVQHDPQQYISFENAEYVKVTVNHVTITPAPPSGATYPLDILTLQNAKLITRYFQLSNDAIDGIPPTGTPLVNITSAVANSGGNPVADELTVGWPILVDQGCNGYQLEWAWLETESEWLYYGVGGTVDPKLLFAQNATRIDLPYSAAAQQYYSIPLYYDGAGTLYYRIRPVNFNASGSRTDGKWSDAAPYPFSGHGSMGSVKNARNWQVRTSYAEEGKRKTVMEYCDGSLRSRQMVTKDNTTNSIVVAETFYDAQGRPAVQVLPTPGLGAVIDYQKNLNVFNSANSPVINTDQATFFDLKPAPTNLALHAGKGAANYYSPQNTLVNSGEEKGKYIPDAAGYPYTLTRYTLDGTGRIAAQGGVGVTHQPGSGHETKYFYGTPTQEELDGLFGIEVGYKSHYFKNMVQDANGQMSVS